MFKLRLLNYGLIYKKVSKISKPVWFEILRAFPTPFNCHDMTNMFKSQVASVSSFTGSF